MALTDLRVLALIPPMTQLNTPYPSTAYLTGFLRSRGLAASQEDLALGLVLRLFTPTRLDALRAAPYPKLVISGGWHPAFDAVCDVLVDRLGAGRAVVALESTLITHGLPHPANVETALAMEAAVRAAGDGLETAAACAADQSLVVDA